MAFSSMNLCEGKAQVLLVLVLLARIVVIFVVHSGGTAVHIRSLFRLGCWSAIRPNHTVEHVVNL